MKEEVKEISNFYAKYTVTNLDEQTQIVYSAQQMYLVKMIRLQVDTADIDSVVDTLEQHLTLNDQYLLTLLHYQMHTNNTGIHIRSIYQYASSSLQEEINNRRPRLQYFESRELWTVLYNVIRALQYLQRLNIGYGVLGCDKIFIGQKIRLLDPSAVAEDPLQVTNNRLHSPEILLEHNQIDILKSDVFIFGLCMLQAALLIDFSPEFGRRIDETRVRLYLDNVSQIYQAQFSHMLRLMLQFNPSDRPSFSQIKQYLQNILDFNKQTQWNPYCPLSVDHEDQYNLYPTLEETTEFQNVDIEDEEISSNHTGSLSDFQKAKLKFLIESCSDNAQFLSRISQNSQASSISRSSIAGKQKKKISKSIKQKLVKQLNSNDLQIVQLSQYKPDQVFTNPKLLAEIQNELQHIANRTNLRSKENFPHNR